MLLHYLVKCKGSHSVTGSVCVSTVLQKDKELFQQLASGTYVCYLVYRLKDILNKFCDNYSNSLIGFKGFFSPKMSFFRSSKDAHFVKIVVKNSAFCHFRQPYITTFIATFCLISFLYSSEFVAKSAESLSEINQA